MSLVLTIFGATGAQGGSVVEAVLKNAVLSKKYRLRGVTRDTSKPAAQALAAKGVELVKADLNNTDSIRAAIRGSHAVFAVTNYWETASKDTEVKQGRNVADASVEEGVHHLIWSSLPAVTKMTNGQLSNVEHFDSKAEVEDYIRSLPESKLPVASFFQPAFYMSNIKSMLRPGPDGVKVFAQPWDPLKTKVALLDTKADTGKFVASHLLAPESDINRKAAQGTSDWKTPTEIVDTITSVSGTKGIFKEVTKEDAIQAMGGNKVAIELTENMLLIRDYSYFGKGSENETAKSQAILPEKPTTWSEFVKAQGSWE